MDKIMTSNEISTIISNNRKFIIKKKIEINEQGEKISRLIIKIKQLKQYETEN